MEYAYQRNVPTRDNECVLGASDPLRRCCGSKSSSRKSLFPSNMCAFVVDTEKSPELSYTVALALLCIYCTHTRSQRISRYPLRYLGSIPNYSQHDCHTKLRILLALRVRFHISGGKNPTLQDVDKPNTYLHDVVCLAHT